MAHYMNKYKTAADTIATGLIANPAAAAPAVEITAEELAEAEVDEVFELVVLLTSVVVLVPFFVVDVVTLELPVLVEFDKTMLV